MRIVQIDDSYIDQLKREFPSVLDSKKLYRRHSRKYIGIVLSINNSNYYVPFSSPKTKDYNSDGTIKKNNLFSVKMTKDGLTGEKVLLGTLRFNCMIPVPLKYVIGYSIENEADLNYKDVVSSEHKFISKNQRLIIKTATRIYRFKEHEEKNKNPKNERQYNSILPFKKIEEFVSTKIEKN